MSEERRALAKLESLLAAAPVGIAFFDRDLRYVRVNQALATINGKPIDDHLGHRLGQVLPDVAATLDPLLRQVLETGEPVLGYEMQLGTRSFLGDFFAVRMDLETIGVGAFVVEITDRKRVEDELRNAVRSRDDVLAVVSHDLRNPVSSIMLSATLLAQEIGDSPLARKHVEVMQRSVARLQHLLDDLIDSVNIRAGRLSLQITPHSVAALLNEAAELQEPIAAERAITVELEQTVEVAIRCDRHRILQVFGNLMANALKYCRAGDTIRITSEITRGDVTFGVHDNGPGIASDVMATLFTPHRTPHRHPRSGSGLGLQICRGIIEQHGGRIWIRSELTRGTSVFFTVPIAPS